MRKLAAFVIVILLPASSIVAQDNWGKITFANRNIPSSYDPTVLYNVPIYQMGGRATGTGAGNLPGGVTVGLFPAGSVDTAAPIVSMQLRTGTVAQAQYFVSSVIATIPGVPPGARANLIVRAWQGACFECAKTGGGMFGEWAFTSQPLGGIPSGGGAEIFTPSMTGWGPENGAGYEILEFSNETQQPQARITSPTNHSVFSAGATIRINGEVTSSLCYNVTNLMLAVNDLTLARSATNTISATTQPLPIGSYELAIFAQGNWCGGGDEAGGRGAVNITVINPSPIALSVPTISGGAVNFTHSADVGLGYVVETSADLLNWRSLGPTNAAPSNPAKVIDAIDPVLARYYRVRQANP